MADEVGVRELRQNLSVYLRRVREGERFTVTERNKPVASLGPLPQEDDNAWWQDLVKEHGLTQEEPGDILDVEPAPYDRDKPTIAEMLEDLRDERHD